MALSPPPADRPHAFRHILAGALALSVIVLGAGGVPAQDAPIPPADEVAPWGRDTKPDLLNGQYVVTSGGSAAHKGACLYCHGADGAGDGVSAAARLAGQHLGYLRKQLHGYARESRPHPIMTPIAQALTEAEILDVSAYYAAQSAPPATPDLPPVPDPVIEQARRLALEGDPARGLRPCAVCHGEEGQGNAPAIPYLAGQWASVIELQLILWQEGVRENDPLNSMERVAARLTREEMRALALYYAGLPPPDGGKPDLPAPTSTPASATADGTG